MNNIITHPSLKVIGKRLERLQAAAKLTLLFHSASPWDLNKQQQWLLALHQCYNEGHFFHTMEATTKVLCDAVRAALEEK